MLEKVRGLGIVSLCTVLVFSSPACREVSDEDYELGSGLPTLLSLRFVDESHGWVTGYQMVFHTCDGGRSWQRHSIPKELQPPVTNSSAVQSAGALVWADRKNVLLRSDEGLLEGNIISGQWRKVLVPAPLLRQLRDIKFTDRQHGWAIGYYGAYLTSDGGATWRVAHTNLSSMSLNHVFPLSPAQAWTVGMNGTVAYTIDGGQTWKRQELPGRGGMRRVGRRYGPDLTSVQFVNPRRGWLCGEDGLIYQTTDGGEHWQMQETGVFKKLRAVSFVDAKEGWVLGSDYLIFHTRDGGVHWENKYSNTEAFFLDIQALPNGRAWVLGGEDRYDPYDLLFTTDYGETWSVVKLDLEERGKQP